MHKYPHCKKSINITNGEKFDDFLIKNKKYLIPVIILIIIWWIWALLYYKPYIEYCWHRPQKGFSSDLASELFTRIFMEEDCPCYWMNVFSNKYTACKEEQESKRKREEQMSQRDKNNQERTKRMEQRDKEEKERAKQMEQLEKGIK